ncbi:hypothetical protein, partial [Vibrio vulnificus]|uniref:hypothetical protein n=1 Tax=Vibrio vulnificus TaxID=672 RepID=UPI0039B62D8F
FGLAELPAGSVHAVIWTTTPRTNPANQALNMHPEHVYALVQTDAGCLVLAEALVEQSLKRFGREGRVLATATGDKLERIAF